MFSRFFPSAFCRCMVVSLAVCSLLMTMMIPVAFAAENDSYSFQLTTMGENTYFDSLLPEGSYTITIQYRDLFGVYLIEKTLSDVNIVYDHTAMNIFQQLIEFSTVDDNGKSTTVTYEFFIYYDGGAYCFKIYNTEGKFIGGTDKDIVVTFAVPAPPTAIDQVAFSFSTVLSWFGAVISSLVAPDGVMSGLFVVLAIPIAIALIFITIRLVRHFTP